MSIPPESFSLPAPFTAERIDLSQVASNLKSIVEAKAGQADEPNVDRTKHDRSNLVANADGTKIFKASSFQGRMWRAINLITGNQGKATERLEQAFSNTMTALKEDIPKWSDTASEFGSEGKLTGMNTTELQDAAKTVAKDLKVHEKIADRIGQLPAALDLGYGAGKAGAVKEALDKSDAPIRSKLDMAAKASKAFRTDKTGVSMASIARILKTDYSGEVQGEGAEILNDTRKYPPIAKVLVYGQLVGHAKELAKAQKKGRVSRDELEAILNECGSAQNDWSVLRQLIYFFAPSSGPAPGSAEGLPEGVQKFLYLAGEIGREGVKDSLRADLPNRDHGDRVSIREYDATGASLVITTSSTQPHHLYDTIVEKDICQEYDTDGRFEFSGRLTTTYQRNLSGYGGTSKARRTAIRADELVAMPLNSPPRKKLTDCIVALPQVSPPPEDSP